METKFNLKRCLIFILGLHILAYLGWSFVEFSFYQPIQQTLNDETSRGMYLVFLIVIIFFGLPYYAPFKDE